MDLNQPLIDDGSDEVMRQNSMMDSFLVPSHQGRSEENSERRSEASGMMPDWLTQIMSQGNNSHRALEQFQKLHPLHLKEKPTYYNLKSGCYK